MNITIREMDESTVQFVKTYGSSFEVTSKLELYTENGKIRYTIVDVPPYTKQYGLEKFDPSIYVSNPDRVIFFAYVAGQLAGQIRILKSWNHYAYIDDIAVHENYRGQGVGRALMEHAIAWAKSKGFPGMMLETQNNNVAGCRLYARCGFELCGFDTHLYKAVDPGTDEIALYWYLMF
ncbi:MAG TPA: GNAT family N-acetyltransferase [Anaerolineales bacterium]|nr:GNAT family N-acetyltransferase [Anaerolineales bacterium]